jgi:hypothetical protein
LENPPGATNVRDGIDIDHCESVDVSDVSGTNLNLVLCLMSSRVVVRRVTGRLCRAQAVAVGDPTFMQEDMEAVAVLSCTAEDCGMSYKGAPASGLAVLTTPGHSVKNVLFQDCMSLNKSRVQRFGFGVSAGASGVRVVNCRFEGVESRVHLECPPQNVEFVGTETSG